MKKTKIICTMGPATDNPAVLKELMLSGMDIVRLNFSHGTHEEQKKRIDMVKELRKEVGLPIAILLDTQGPEIRTGLIENGEMIVEAGEEITLTTVEMVGNKEKIYINYPLLPQDVNVENKILIDDGLIELEVLSKTETEILCKIHNGGKISNRKGVNVPGIALQLPAITDKDKEDILFGIENEVDFIAASFIRNATAVNEIREILSENNANIHIIAKIENEEGLNNLYEIVDASDGIMIARGDLGVEIPEEQVPFVQKSISRICNNRFKPVITATQMLDSMMRNPRPTRAEVTDVANAILDGTDAIMLSGETAAGKYPVESVKTMVKIALDTEYHLNYEQIFKAKKGHRGASISHAVCYSTVATSVNLKAKLIIASSMSGFTAKTISKFKPEAMILGTSPSESALRKMQLYWSVVPVKTKQVSTTDALLDYVVDTAVNAKLAQIGDTVIITAGIPTGISSVTNMMKVVVIEE